MVLYGIGQPFLASLDLGREGWLLGPVRGFFGIRIPLNILNSLITRCLAVITFVYRLSLCCP